jgi:hypothetical protein
VAQGGEPISAFRGFTPSSADLCRIPGKKADEHCVNGRSFGEEVEVAQEQV